MCFLSLERAHLQVILTTRPINLRETFSSLAILLIDWREFRRIRSRNAFLSLWVVTDHGLPDLGLSVMIDLFFRAIHKSRTLGLESSSRSWLVGSLMIRVTESSDSCGILTRCLASHDSETRESFIESSSHLTRVTFCWLESSNQLTCWKF